MDDVLQGLCITSGPWARKWPGRSEGKGLLSCGIGKGVMSKQDLNKTFRVSEELCQPDVPL